MSFDYLDCLGIKLKWWQKLYLKFNPTLFYSCRRRTYKTGVDFMNLLERLKNKAKTSEEKQMYEAMQKEWGKLCIGLNLGYWNKL